MRAKHVPQRSCVGCGRIRPKRELLRLVHTAEGKVEIDRSGKKAGRGAYLCPDPQCWDLALKGSRLEHVLRTRIGATNYETLTEAKLLLEAGFKATRGDANDN